MEIGLRDTNALLLTKEDMEHTVEHRSGLKSISKPKSSYQSASYIQIMKAAILPFSNNIFVKGARCEERIWYRNLTTSQFSPHLEAPQ